MCLSQLKWNSSLRAKSEHTSWWETFTWSEVSLLWSQTSQGQLFQLSETSSKMCKIWPKCVRLSCNYTKMLISTHSGCWARLSLIPRRAGNAFFLTRSMSALRACESKLVRHRAAERTERSVIVVWDWRVHVCEHYRWPTNVCVSRTMHETWVVCDHSLGSFTGSYSNVLPDVFSIYLGTRLA